MHASIHGMQNGIRQQCKQDEVGMPLSFHSENETSAVNLKSSFEATVGMDGGEMTASMGGVLMVGGWGTWRCGWMGWWVVGWVNVWGGEVVG